MIWKIIAFVVFNSLFSQGVALAASVAGGFLIGTLLAYLLNRRFTFEIREGWLSFSEIWRFVAVNVVAFGATEVIVLSADRWFGPLSQLHANLAKVVAAAVILIPKFFGYRDFAFGNRGQP